MSEDDKKDPDSVPWKNTSLPKQMLFMKHMCLVPQTKVPMRQLTSMSQEYDKSLRHLANSCKLEALLDDFVRDRLVLGTNDNSAQARMFREKDLPLDAAINICRVSELSQMQLKHIEKSEPEVQFVKTSKHRKTNHQKQADKVEFRDLSIVESHTKEAVISVVLMERDAPNVANFTILLVCASLGKVESNLQISVKMSQITVTLTIQYS